MSSDRPRRRAHHSGARVGRATDRGWDQPPAGGCGGLVVAHGGPSVVTTNNLPAVLLRDPENPHDSDAIRVLIGGVHIGFVPAREAARFQPLLQECERRGVLLVGSVRLKGGDGSPWGAGVQIRPNLDGWQSTMPKIKPTAKKKPPKAPAALLQGDDLALWFRPSSDSWPKSRSGRSSRRVS